jgi:hypothetical protein
MVLPRPRTAEKFDLHELNLTSLVNQSSIEIDPSDRFRRLPSNHPAGMMRRH